MSRTVTSRRRDERGLSIVLFALLMTGMLTMVAIVVDLGALRESRRANQSATDLAALAAGVDLTSGDSVGACTLAFDYLKNNVPALSSASAPDCADTPTMGSCVDSGGDPTAEYNAATTSSDGKITVTITYPVPNSDSTMAAVPINATHDGTSCQRMKVAMTRTTPTAFAGAIGVASQTSNSSSIVRRFTSSNGSIPALWLLDPTDCKTLTVSGGSNVTIGTATVPGIVSVDSNGASCSGSVGSTATITVDNSSTLHAIDNGAVNLFAMPSGATQCQTGGSYDCIQGQVTGGQISPQPVSMPARATRAPVDWAYNCKASYPSPVPPVPETACPNASIKAPYVDNLRSQLGSVGSAPPQGGPWERWVEDGGMSCKNNSTPAVPTLGAGYTGWWIDCESQGGLQIQPGVTVTVPSGNVVLDGGLSIGGSHSSQGTFIMNAANTNLTLAGSCTGSPLANAPFPSLCTNSSAATASFLYMRDGALSDAGNLTLSHVAVIQGTAAGQQTSATVGSANAVISWTAPSDGAFDGLALWAEAPGYAGGCSGSVCQYSMTGNSSTSLNGVFFMAGATPFKLSGGGSFIQDNAQFVAYQMAISGGGTVQLAPNLNAAIPEPPPSGILIR